MKEEDLKRLSGRERIPQGIIYKDYVITAVLKKISELTYSDELVFKGGTCIKKIYFQDARFSVDIDFTCLEDISERIFTDLGTVLGNHRVYNVEFDGMKTDERRDDSSRYRIRYRDFNGHPNSVILDLSFRENPLLKTGRREILNPFYEDIPTFNLRTLELKEIMAEKIRAAVTRTALRDLFDIWYLLKNGVVPDMQLVEKKMNIYRENFDRKSFLDKIENYRGHWVRDLRTLIPDSPEFDMVKDEVSRYI